MREILRREDGKGAILLMEVASEEQARKICRTCHTPNLAC